MKSAGSRTNLSLEAGVLTVLVVRSEWVVGLSPGNLFLLSKDFVDMILRTRDDVLVSEDFLALLLES